MGTDVTIVVAFKDFGEVHRRRALDYVLGWYAPTSYRIVIADRDGGKPAAVNAAVMDAGDIIVQADADSLVPLDRLAEAVELARVPGLVVPFSRYLYLTLAATRSVLSGKSPTSLGPEACEEHGPGGVGNVVVYSRETWKLAGGLDERFTMWGGDDAAFAYACEALAGPTRRLPGDMWHLWHPRRPGSKPGHPEYVAQMAILGEYRDAAAVGPDAVRAVVEAR